MRFPWLKVLFFFCLWYEIAAEFRIESNVALVLAIGALALWWNLPRLLSGVIMYLGPLMTGLMVRAAMWAALFWWLAPPALRSVPWIFLAAGVLALAYLGAQLRHTVNAQGPDRIKAKMRKHSAWVVLASFGAVALVFAGLRYVDTAWMLVGYVALPGLPMFTGWQLAEMVAPRRPDAKVGDDDSFHDAGLSGER